METIIKKAIEGGYLYVASDIIPKDFQFKDMITDADFWQALGKACGWEDRKYCPTCTVGEGNMVGCEYHALRFYEINLTEGWDKAVEYLEEVIRYPK